MSKMIYISLFLPPATVLLPSSVHQPMVPPYVSFSLWQPTQTALIVPSSLRIDLCELGNQKKNTRKIFVNI